MYSQETAGDMLHVGLGAESNKLVVGVIQFVTNCVH